MSDTRPVLLTADDLIPDRALTASDPDRLDHIPIAERLAELIVSADAPVNVALFGPWGSGKTSFSQLLRQALRRQDKRTELIVYDTWTSAGESFQRSFISNAATEMGFQRGKRDGHDFHEGLYERKRGVRVSGANFGRFLVWFAISTLAVFILIGLLLALLMVVLSISVVEITASLPGAIPAWLTASGILGVVGAVIKEGLAGAKLDVETSAPTQEQFRQTFRDLVARGKKKHKADRLVFFLDELDRCRPAQVSEILAAVKHFLDQPSCVFVVAADREVMERGLNDLPQANPVIVDAPYYSSASEFIDKVFQHQFSLPPLRMRRLSRFARELIASKNAGIWHELRSAESQGRLLDEVLYVAVPRHVRSPRRVKVLLNNFATNARIAEARGIDWLKRAAEIAKLTTLQTEFPLLADDLHREPRLLTFLLDPPSEMSPRLRRLLAAHKLPMKADEEAGGQAQLEDATATDRQLVDEKVDELQLVQRRQLLAYLRGTAAYPNPSRDLLFLEGAGKAADIEDSAFAEELESNAIEDPARAIAAAEKQTADNQRKALAVLADVVDQEVGRERANATTALLGVAALFDYDVQPFEHEVTSALRMQHRDAGFDDRHLTPALGVAIKASASDVSAAVLADDRLWANPERTADVAALADQLPKERRASIWQRVATAYAKSDDPLTTPLRRLETDVAEEMLDDSQIREAIETRLLSAAEAEPSLGSPGPPLFASISERSQGQARLRGSVVWDLLHAGALGYAAANQSMDQLDQMGDEDIDLRNACVLLALDELAPVAHFTAWTERLRTPHEAWGDESARARKALIRVFEDWSHSADLEDAVVQLSPLVATEDDATFAAEVNAPLAAATGSAPWWTTNEDTAAQRRLHQAALHLQRVGDESFKAASAAVLADLLRALAVAPRANNFQRALRSAREVAVKLHTDDLDTLAAALAGITAVDPLDIALTQERLLMTEALRNNSLPTDAAHHAISAEQMERLRGTSDFSQHLQRWLALSPPVADVIAVVTPMVGAASAEVRRAVGSWSRRQSKTGRTDVLLGLLNAKADIASWVEVVAEAPIEEQRFVDAVGSVVRALTRAHERTDYLRSLAAFRPASDEGQRAIAALFIWLVEQTTKVDFDNAMTLSPSLGANHGSTARLNEALKAAGDRGHEPKGRALEHLARARVTLTKKRVSKPLWERWRGLRG